MSSELRDGDSDSSGDESEKVTASWNDMSTSMSDAIVKFWTDHPLSQPANHDAALHPFRKLFSRFSRSAPPSKMKLSLYLIHRAMDMPRMIFYGMGIMSSKAMVQLKWFKPEVRPSTILLETCKDFFNSLKKLDFNDAGVIIIIFLSDFIPSATAIDVHVLPEPNPW